MSKNLHQGASSKNAQSGPKMVYQVPIALSLTEHAQASYSCMFGGFDRTGNCPHGHIPSEPLPTRCSQGSYHR